MQDFIQGILNFVGPLISKLILTAVWACVIALVAWIYKKTAPARERRKLRNAEKRWLEEQNKSSAETPKGRADETSAGYDYDYDYDDYDDYDGKGSAAQLVGAVALGVAGGIFSAVDTAIQYAEEEKQRQYDEVMKAKREEKNIRDEQRIRAGLKFGVPYEYYKVHAFERVTLIVVHRLTLQEDGSCVAEKAEYYHKPKRPNESEWIEYEGERYYKDVLEGTEFWRLPHDYTWAISGGDIYLEDTSEIIAQIKFLASGNLLPLKISQDRSAEAYFEKNAEYSATEKICTQK